MIKTKEKLYFAYGSNMNLNQMAFRCPDAEVVESVRLEGYRLAFRTNGGGNGVATILPEEGSYVDGVLCFLFGRYSEWMQTKWDRYPNCNRSGSLYTAGTASEGSPSQKTAPSQTQRRTIN